MLLFFKRHIWIVSLLICLVLFPQSLNLQAELNMRLIITAFAVDLNQDDTYSITAQIVTPESSGSGTSSTKIAFIKSQGKTIGDAIFSLTYKHGKTASFNHINCIIVSKQLAESDKLMPSLDYFVRDDRIPTSALLLVAEDKAEDLIKQTKELESGTSIALQQVFLYKEQGLNGIMTQLHEFVNDNYNIPKSSMLSTLKLVSKSDDQENSSVSGSTTSQDDSSSSSSQDGGSGSAGGDGSGQSSSNTPTAEIAYLNPIYGFKNGKISCKIEGEDELYGIYFVNPKSEDGTIMVQDVNDHLYKNAKVTVHLRDKKTKTNFKIIDGQPTLIVKISTNRNEVTEIVNESGHQQSLDLLKVSEKYLTPELKKALEQKITTCVTKAFKYAKQYNTDIFSAGDLFYKTHNKQWQNYINSLNNPDEYLKGINIKVEVDIGERL